MSLDFQSLGRQLSPPQVNILLLVAASQIDIEVNMFGQNTASAGAEFTFSLDRGVEIWFLKVFRPPRGYLTYGQLRTMITGLQIYLVIGRRSEAVRFDVLYGADNVVLGHGAVGSLWPPDPPTDTIAQ